VGRLLPVPGGQTNDPFRRSRPGRPGWGSAADAALAVVTQPDPRCGERVVLVTGGKDATRAPIQAHARARGASDLMVPADLLVIDKLP
jgi:hypothetical protein